ncbi:SAC3 domain-containing protein 1 [Pectinophora gossypiella]|uniref:SAC3 domain-containing protein 1 n=1 Tax=Pectinophora gossypiella TaxID=13191 RepID=UPI00214E81F4|nr:SAC3 domain-containing protein 1 [Pectinophora gossypiella]
MSYFEYFCANIERKNSDEIKGTCNSMCPQDEVTMREKERLVHVLEVLGPKRMLVKTYRRSAADSNMALPRNLRPYPVLRDTVHYLLLDVTKRTDVSTACVYDFLNDRLRAVRQDMTIQRLCPENCASLLEPMIRFYVYYGYRLCELPIKDYDPVLNKKYLLECMKWFLTCKKNEKMEISSLFSNMNITYKLKCDRVLIESLYLLCNLDDLHPLYRYLTLPKDLKSHPQLKLAYSIAVANLKGNFVQVCKLMDRLCPLTFCALCIYLPVLQRKALLVLSHAYSSKSLSVPAAALRRWLRYNSDGDAMDACAHYGVAVQASGGVVRFGKEFKHDVATLQPMKLLNLDKDVDLSVDNVFTYTVSY